jgi:hypothetical protein
MPVSKKRKKDGKPVQRAVPPALGAEHPHGPDAKPVAASVARPPGKPTNPFVSMSQTKRGAQRGR